MQGNRKAQYSIYQLYAKAMLNVCYRMMQNKEDAEDMMQDAFADAFRRMSGFRFESTFGAWLKRIMINRCINEMRRKKANLQFFDDMHVFAQKTEEESNDYGLTVDQVRKAMRDLPSGSKMIFSLYLLEGYDHNEISEILNISVSNSKTQYMRARHRVKEILTQTSYEN
ncbi:MAG: sigma-70 family RNA polymerase sigma factor [Bacteroidetes bacterium]|nr:sigma-70 family RNA polymerase sigma factor [Bacteroidota bacterium]